MIISDVVRVRVGSKSYKYYKNKNDIFNKKGEEIIVKVIDLLPTTDVNVIVKCDFCNNNVETSYKNYYRNFNNLNLFSCCAKCTDKKNRIINLKKYGVEFINQIESIKKKTRENSVKNVKRYDMNLLSQVELDFTKFLVTKDVMITINKWNINHFKKLGYQNLILNHKWIVPVEHLMRYSSVKIECKCVFCNKIQVITFQKYMLNYERSGYYSCRHCNNETLKETMMKKYGVNNSAYIEEFINKKKRHV